MKIRHIAIAAFVALPLGMVAMAGAGGATSPLGQPSRDTVTAEQTPGTVEAELPEGSIVDEVVWVVGDEPILRSDIEMMRMQGMAEGVKWGGNPDCAIPEQLAVQKLFLHQAAIDSIEVTESEIAQGVDQQIRRWVEAAGGEEKLEEYRKQSINEIRASLHDDFKNQQLIQKMRQKLTEDIKVSPADVRSFFRTLPEDSIPYVPTEVEVQIIVREPKIKQEEINRVKNLLREYTERVTNGETTFATLARLYSEDPGTARLGGEMDYVGRGLLDPAFANVAFNLTDPKKISKIVETEFGYHIIQLIDKRGDKIKCRHILLKPKVSPAEIEAAETQLDSIRTEIVDGKFSFDEGAAYLSQDKDTRNNRGLMSNSTVDGMTSRFQMKELPTEIARAVDTMRVGDISRSFQMVNNKGKTVVAIAKLKSRIEGHKATISEDFQVMKDIVLNKEREKAINDWVANKIKHTYVRVNDSYKDCDFQYQGWIK